MQEIDAKQALDEAFKSHAAGQYQRAETLYDALIAHDETHWASYFGLGTLYAQACKNGLAIALLRRSLELNPDSADGYANLAAVYRRLENKEVSRDLNLKALAIERSANALSNMAGTYINDGDPEPALAYADEALKVSPGFPEAGNHKALALLELGRYDEGWAQYESRLSVPGFHRRPYQCPMWDGRQTEILAVHGEQGLGDEIMFLTLLNQCRGLAKEIHVECAVRLVSVFRNSFPGIKFYGTHTELICATQPTAYIPMGSLPRLMPWKKDAYLKGSQTYHKGAWPRLGISWRGGTEHTHQKLRNAPIEVWRPLVHTARMLGIETISLQYGPADDMAKVLDVPHDSADIADMDVLTSMVQSCDLVVSVCNTTVHQAGASNTPCLQLVPSKPDWRCGLTDERYRWYDSVENMRQANGESWADVLLRATDYLKDWAETHCDGHVE